MELGLFLPLFSMIWLYRNCNAVLFIGHVDCLQMCVVPGSEGLNMYMYISTFEYHLHQDESRELVWWIWFGTYSLWRTLPCCHFRKLSQFIRPLRFFSHHLPTGSAVSHFNFFERLIGKTWWLDLHYCVWLSFCTASLMLYWPCVFAFIIFLLEY